jgi:signal transduction protein with GAF and PtsI domain
MNRLVVEIEDLLEEHSIAEGGAEEFSVRHVLDLALRRIVEGMSCTTGTLHDYDPDAKVLNLLAQKGIPEAILDRVTRIPVGKGMAGLAAERREPVQVCNLQTDESGVVRPGAKQTRMEGAIACPMLFQGRLAGTLGVAKPEEYEFGAEERKVLAELGERIGRFLTHHRKSPRGEASTP